MRPILHWSVLKAGPHLVAVLFSTYLVVCQVELRLSTLGYGSGSRMRSVRLKISSAEWPRMIKCSSSVTMILRHSRTLIMTTVLTSDSPSCRRLKHSSARRRACEIARFFVRLDGTRLLFTVRKCMFFGQLGTGRHCMSGAVRLKGERLLCRLLGSLMQTTHHQRIQSPHETSKGGESIVGTRSYRQRPISALPRRLEPVYHR